MEDIKSWFGSPQNRPGKFSHNSIKDIKITDDTVSLVYECNPVTSLSVLYIPIMSLISIPENKKISIESSDSNMFNKICIYGDTFSDVSGMIDADYYTEELVGRLYVPDEYRFNEIEISGNFESYDKMIHIINILFDRLSASSSIVVIHADCKFMRDDGSVVTIANALSLGYVPAYLSTEIKFPIYYDFKRLNIFKSKPDEVFHEAYTRYTEFE